MHTNKLFRPKTENVHCGGNAVPPLHALVCSSFFAHATEYAPIRSRIKVFFNAPSGQCVHAPGSLILHVRWHIRKDLCKREYIKKNLFLGSCNFFMLAWHLFDRRTNLHRDPRIPILLDQSQVVPPWSDSMQSRKHDLWFYLQCQNLSEISRAAQKETRLPFCFGQM